MVSNPSAGGEHNSFRPAPGNHLVAVEFRYLGSSVGEATANVYVIRGELPHVTYWSPKPLTPTWAAERSSFIPGCLRIAPETVPHLPGSED